MAKRSFLSRPTSLRSPSPASHQESQGKVLEPLDRDLQLHALCCFSNQLPETPKLQLRVTIAARLVLGRRWGSSCIPEPRVGQLLLPPSTEHQWRFLMRISVARSMSPKSWVSLAWADQHCPMVPGALGPLVRVCRPAACPGEANGL